MDTTINNNNDKGSHKLGFDMMSRNECEIVRAKAM
jgi:hypothetical protein